MVTSHPSLSCLGSTIRKYLFLLYQDPSVKKLLTPAPFASFRSGYSLKNHLVRAKMYPLERKVVSSKCGKNRCQPVKMLRLLTTFEVTLIREHI